MGEGVGPTVTADSAATPPGAGDVPGPRSTDNSIAAVARRLLQQLSADDLEPGSKLPAERQLATELGVGRAAVREVLAALELLGVVDSRHGSGTYLTDNPSMLLPQAIEWGLLLQRPQTLQLVEARRHLEVSLAGIAAAQRDPEGLLRLQELLSAMRARAVDGDVDAFVEADAQFHLEVAALSKNTVLAGMLNSVSSLLRVWMSRAVRAGDGPVEATMVEHQAVLDAIADGRPAQAEKAMREHMRAAEARLFKSLGRTTA